MYSAFPRACRATINQTNPLFSRSKLSMHSAQPACAHPYLATPLDRQYVTIAITTSPFGYWNLNILIIRFGDVVVYSFP